MATINSNLRLNMTGAEADAAYARAHAVAQAWRPGIADAEPAPLSLTPPVSGSAGESPATLEKAELVDENGKSVRRYMRALPTQPLCLACHGPAEQMKPAVVARLKALYPEDRATGYRVGEIRGAMTIRKPL